MGDRQVTIAGADDKRAVTLMVAITASGDLLRTQVIVAGKTERSLPAAHLRTAVNKKIRYDYSGGNKHWSNISMMKRVSSKSYFIIVLNLTLSWATVDRKWGSPIHPTSQKREETTW